MADQKISQLANADPLTGDELLVMVQSGTNVKITADNLAEFSGTDLSYDSSTRVLSSSTGTDTTLPVATTSIPGLQSAADKTKLDGIAAGAQVNVATNLSYTAATRLLESSTGTDVTLPVATTSDAGLLSSSDKTKLDGIAAGAEVNVNADWNAASGDAQILNKPTLGTAAALNVGTSANNVVQLDGSAKLPAVDGSALTGINAATDLSYTAATRVLASSTGTDATLPLVTSTDAGLAPASGGGTTNFLRADGTWAAAGSPPAGSNTQIQFNDSGAFGGDADLTYNKTTNALSIGGDVTLNDGGSFTTTLQTITPTANRTLSLPDATGTVGLVGGSSGQLTWNNAGAYAGASTLTYDGSILTTSGRFINSYTSLASAPSKAWTGTWFTGGTATTTKPHVLIEPTGATSTAWSTSGTGLGVNAASGFAGNLLDLQLNGTSVFSIPVTGAVAKYTTAVATTYLEIKGSTAAISGYGVGSLFGFVGTTSAHPFQIRSGNTTRLTLESAGGFTVADANDIAVGTTTGTKIGTATTQKLGFFNKTPVVQPAAVADLTTTATTGSLPTANGTVTIADAAAPTNAELLEYCVELEAKLEAALGRLRDLGLIAT